MVSRIYSKLEILCLHEYCGTCQAGWFTDTPAQAVTNVIGTISRCETAAQACTALRTMLIWRRCSLQGEGLDNTTGSVLNPAGGSFNLWS